MPRLRWFHIPLFLIGMMGCNELVHACTSRTLPWLAQHFSHIPVWQQVMTIFVLLSPYLLIWNLIIDNKKVDLWFGIRMTLLFTLTSATNQAFYTVCVNSMPPPEGIVQGLALAPAAFFALWVMGRKQFTHGPYGTTP
jgi:hypothetical protein